LKRGDLDEEFVKGENEGGRGAGGDLLKSPLIPLLQRGISGEKFCKGG